MLKYSLKQGIKNTIQNRLFSLAAIGTIAICLFLLGLFYALFINFNHMVYNAESKVGITVFFDKGIGYAEIQDIADEIRTCKTVKKVTYISPEEAWENFKKEMYQSDREIEESFGDDNPLQDSASLEVYLTKVTNQEAIINTIKKIPGVRKVNGSHALAEKLASFNSLIAYVSVSIILLLVFVSVFLISMSVATGIRFRHDEIIIMTYIGATEKFIKLPFIVEGVVVGFVGAIIPLLGLWFLYEKIIIFLSEHFTELAHWLTFVTRREIFAGFIPVSLLVGIGIGYFGSSWSVKKHIRG